MSNDLDGLLVISLEQAVAAPYCSRLLRESGARVIKLERPEGDFARQYDDILAGDSAYFVWLNSGKESVTVDLKSDMDVTLLKKLIKKADIFIQNLRPGAVERLGFGYESVHKLNPNIVMCSISGYGSQGSYSKMKAYDALIQAETGLCSVTGPPGEPSKVGASIVDIATGLTAYGEILKKLIKRGTKSESGAHIELSLFEVLSEWLSVPLSYYEYADKLLQGTGMDHGQICPYGAYEAKDGKVFIVVQNHMEWVRLCEQVLGKPALVSNHLYDSNMKRIENRDALKYEIEIVFKLSDRDQLMDSLLAAGVACGSINTLQDLSKHNALKRKNVLSSGNNFSLIRRVGDENQNLEVPDLGAHSEDVRREFS
jgi:crotonobetainyl-CoA:carnitine CoA-transferase CaiB-like acyl-CoA transferase